MTKVEKDAQRAEAIKLLKGMVKAAREGNA